MTGRHVRTRNSHGAHRAQRFLDALFSVGVIEEDTSPEADAPQSTSPVWGLGPLDGAATAVESGPPALSTAATPPRSARSHVNGGRSGIFYVPEVV